MKKVFSIVAVAVVATAFVACGPSAEEKAKLEERAKFMQDSIAAAINQSMEAAATEAAPADSAAATLKQLLRLLRPNNLCLVS